MKSNFKLEKGFTLIELIVVVGVIAVLSTALLTILNPIAQIQKARDTQRKADLSKIQASLEFVRADLGCYPSSTSGCLITALPDCNNSLVYSGVTYIEKMTCDPTTKIKYGYSSTLTGNRYTLTACLERKNDPQKTACPAGFACSSKECFQVSNP